MFAPSLIERCAHTEGGGAIKISALRAQIEIFTAPPPWQNLVRPCALDAGPGTDITFQLFY